MTATHAAESAAARRRQDRRRTITVVSLGTLLGSVVFTAPLSTLPAIAAGLRAGPAAQSWVLSSMSLGLALALLTCGAVGDDVGRRRVFVAGAGVLAVASAGCAVAPTPLVFVLGRVVEGIGTAAVLACGLGIIGHGFPAGRDRTRATGTWGASLGAGIAIGPLLGPAVEFRLDWRAVHVLVAVLGAVLAVAARRLLTESCSGRGRTVDLPGVGLLASGLAGLLAGLTEGRQGWTRPLELALLAGGALLLGAFWLRQRLAGAPMLDLTLFRRPGLRSATVAALATGAGVTALMSFIPTLLQRGLGQGALASAVLLLAWSATSVLASVGARHVGEHVSGPARLVGGLVAVAAGLVALAGLDVRATDWRLLAGLVVSGVGTGVLNATLGREAVATAPPAQAGMGSGINTTSRYVGAAIGVTIVATVAIRPGAHPADLVAGWNAAALVCAAFSLLGALGVLACQPNGITVRGNGIRGARSRGPHPRSGPR